MMDGSVEREQRFVDERVFVDEQSHAGRQVNLVPEKKPRKFTKRKVILICCVALVVLAIVVSLVLVLNLRSVDSGAEWTMEQQEVINDISLGALNIPDDELDEYFAGQLSENQDAEIDFRIKLTEISTLVGRGLIDQAIEEAEAIDTSVLSEHQLMDYYGAMQSLYYNAGNDEQASTYQDLYMDTYYKIYGDEEVGG